MQGLLAGKLAVVTGASRGIGQAIAEAFAAEGAHLVLTAEADQEEELKKVLHAMPRTGFCLHCSIQSYVVAYKNTGHQAVGGSACGSLHALKSTFPIWQISTLSSCTIKGKMLQHHDVYTALLVTQPISGSLIDCLQA